ncbi:MAG: hypothetical protein M1828_003606 [Chrysothrix sp. TS-e1954]|nr:MAG: hypothetical protein M1828_003606 [Chrysothrix sp. TS-e1954]
MKTPKSFTALDTKIKLKPTASSSKTCEADSHFNVANSNMMPTIFSTDDHVLPKIDSDVLADEVTFVWSSASNPRESNPTMGSADSSAYSQGWDHDPTSLLIGPCSTDQEISASSLSSNNLPKYVASDYQRFSALPSPQDELGTTNQQVSEMSGELATLHTSLMSTMHAVWSGDESQQNRALLEISKYVSLLRKSAMLRRNTSYPDPWAVDPFQAVDDNIESRPVASAALSVQQLWANWIEAERESRVIYSWVMVEQEVNLFRDKTSMFLVNELELSLPDVDILWNSGSAESWEHAFRRVHQFYDGSCAVASGARPPGLRSTYRRFLEGGDLDGSTTLDLSAFQLRLILQPVQSKVCQVREDINCLAERSFSNVAPSAMWIRTQERLTEVNMLLERWYCLALRFLHADGSSTDPFITGTLIIYHVLCLSTLVDFPSLERDAMNGSMSGRQASERMFFHCGQALAHLRSMHTSVQPPWWPAAVYRVAVILWTQGIEDNVMNLQRCVDMLREMAPVNGYHSHMCEQLCHLAARSV